MSKILFSPLGTTDPITNLRDGGMLHICRYYDIDKVYLYMSKEICEYHECDNRYLYCLEKLGNLLGRKIEYELIKRPDLEDVHIFDFFINEFNEILTDVHNQNPNDEIYVNVSSGTSAMKSALHVLSALREFEIIPIWVSMPEKESSPKAEETGIYDCEGNWECNDDNTMIDNRCNVSANINFLTEIKKQMLAELIKKYDYTGALTLAESMKDMLTEKFVDMLNGAVCRYSLNRIEADKYFKKYGYNFFEAEPIKLDMREYLLYLDMKIKRNELGDFIRGISPILTDLLERILLCRFGINIDEYTNMTKEDAENQKGSKKKVRSWNKKKIKKKSPEFIEVFTKHYNRFHESFVGSSSLAALLEGLSDDDELKKLSKELRSIEKNVRNCAAHSMVRVTDIYIQKNAKMNARGILNKLFKLTKYTDLNLKKDFFESYDRMNIFLLDCLKKG